MKIMTVVGARPQFIKAAAVSRILRQTHEELLVHTGQHYDYNMSEVFFNELDIFKPDYNLGISAGTHGKMTGAMLEAIEAVLLCEKPDCLLVYGDTNSTLAAALAAVKLHVPVCHVEAGNRLGTLTNPEEVNRICTDHVSSLLLCCTQSAVGFLLNEGFKGNVYLVGDPMYDAFLYYGAYASTKNLSEIIGIGGGSVKVPENYYYMTCHRPENTDSDNTLTEILKAADALDAPVIYPVHPRDSRRVQRLCLEQKLSNLLLTEPVGYFSSIALVKGAKKIITDSGGLQREAFFAGKQCVTVFDFIVWPETMVGGANRLAKAEKKDILEKLALPVSYASDFQPFGDGHAAEKITSLLQDVKV